MLKATAQKALLSRLLFTPVRGAKVSSRRPMPAKDVQERLPRAVEQLLKAKPNDPFGFLAKQFGKNANSPVITKLVGREIVDSRANPTVEVDTYCTVLGEEKLMARSGAPSGASTGSNEALELRDGDKKRFMGKGVTLAVKNVNNLLSGALSGRDPTKLRELDNIMGQLDGTRLKTKIGGNAMTAASFSLAEAGAAIEEKELFLHLASVYHGDAVPKQFSLPRPMVNILNGGKHAGGDLQIQEFMIVPKGGVPFIETLRMMCEVYHHLSKILVKEKGVSAKNLGDEGGFAPALKSPTETLTYIERAIVAAGYTVGQDCFLALDCASSEYYHKDKKAYEVEKGTLLNADELIQYYLKLKEKHPALISIEDPFDEKDYEAWQKFTAVVTKKHPDMMLVGDDLYTTNTDLIKKGVANQWATALLLKVNQIGTITESMDAARMIFESGGKVAVSHRSGENPGSLISDLAVAIGAQFIKTGAPARGERVSKYNRLLAIEEYLKENNMLAPYA